MPLENIDTIKSHIENYDKLIRRSELLEHILEYYDHESGNIIIPDKWCREYSQTQMKQIGETPRENLQMKVEECLSIKEIDSYLK